MPAMSPPLHVTVENLEDTMTTPKSMLVLLALIALCGGAYAAGRSDSPATHLASAVSTVAAEAPAPAPLALYDQREDTGLVITCDSADPATVEIDGRTYLLQCPGEGDWSIVYTPWHNFAATAHPAAFGA